VTPDLTDLHQTRRRPLWPALIVALWTVGGGALGGVIGLALSPWWPLTTTESGVLCVLLALGYAVWLLCRKERP
jgi:hypothetical protein